MIEEKEFVMRFELIENDGRGCLLVFIKKDNPVFKLEHTVLNMADVDSVRYWGSHFDTVVWYHKNNRMPRGGGDRWSDLLEEFGPVKVKRGWTCMGMRFDCSCEQNRVFIMGLIEEIKSYLSGLNQNRLDLLFLSYLDLILDNGNGRELADYLLGFVERYKQLRPSLQQQKLTPILIQKAKKPYKSRNKRYAFFGAPKWASTLREEAICKTAKILGDLNKEDLKKNIIFVNHNDIQGSLKNLNIETDIFKKCTYNDYYASEEKRLLIYPVGVITSNPENYHNLNSEYKIRDFINQEESLLGSLYEGGVPGFLKDVLGSGYTNYCNRSRGSVKLKDMKLSLSNGDELWVKVWLWYNY